MNRTQQNYGFSNDPTSEFPYYFHYNDQHQKPWPDDLSASKIGSSSSSTYMGFSHCDIQETRFLGGLQTQPFLLPEISYKTHFHNLSESEQLLHLRNKLLGDLDDSSSQIPSLPFDATHNLQVSHNLCGPQFPHGFISSTSPSYNISAISSNKTRIRWTQDLHDWFVECVNRLGGSDKATPKSILKLMDTEGLTIFHVKSHLQKYRNAKYTPDQSAEGKAEWKSGASYNAADIDIKTGVEFKEALRMQLDVQMRLHEQLEIQRNLQMRIEEQCKQLKMMFDQQQKSSQSFVQTNDRCPKNLPNIDGEYPEAFVLDGPDDDDMVFQTKIS